MPNKHDPYHINFAATGYSVYRLEQLGNKQTAKVSVSKTSVAYSTEGQSASHTRPPT